MQSPLSTYRAIVLSKRALLREQERESAMEQGQQPGTTLSSLTPHTDKRDELKSQGISVVAPNKLKMMIGPPWRHNNAQEARENLSTGDGISKTPLSHTCPYNAETIIRYNWTLEDAAMLAGRRPWVPTCPQAAKELLIADYFLNSPDMMVKKAELEQTRRRGTAAKKKFGLWQREIQ